LQVMILGAGRGTRLASLGFPVPKILVDLQGEPLLSRQLRYLAGEGATRVVVNAHHHADQVEQFAAAHDGQPELLVSVEPELLGTAGGVRQALSLFEPGPIVVLYGDVITDASMEPMMTAHLESGAAATLAVYASPITKDKGTVIADAAGRVTAFAEKDEGAPGARGSSLINAGLYVLDPAFLLKAVAPGQTADFGHDVFPAGLRDGVALGIYQLERPVLDIGTPETLRQAQG
jgi:mannose-1-phosphate guanylyltransferase